jgi:hypothetical protein
MCLDLMPPVSPPFRFDNRFNLFSLQGHVAIDLLDNFVKPLKAFSGCGERFHEIPMMEDCKGLRRYFIG